MTYFYDIPECSSGHSFNKKFLKGSHYDKMWIPGGGNSEIYTCTEKTTIYGDGETRTGQCGAKYVVERVLLCGNDGDHEFNPGQHDPQKTVTSRGKVKIKDGEAYVDFSSSDIQTVDRCQTCRRSSSSANAAWKVEIISSATSSAFGPVGALIKNGELTPNAKSLLFDLAYWVNSLYPEFTSLPERPSFKRLVSRYPFILKIFLRKEKKLRDFFIKARKFSWGLRRLDKENPSQKGRNGRIWLICFLIIVFSRVFLFKRKEIR